PAGAHAEQAPVGHPENMCQECGGPNPVWFAPNHIWNQIVGSEAGMLCPVCFIKRADSKGLYQAGGWELVPEQAPTGQENVVHLHHAPTTPTEVLYQQTVDELRSQLKRFANPWTVEILNQQSNQWSNFCHDAPLTLADAEERERALGTENPDAKFRVVPWLNSSQRAQLSTTREIAKELAAALEHALRASASRSGGDCECGACRVGRHALAKAKDAGLLDEPGRTQPPP
ncbi:MAG: hypothetical protein M3O20_09375, partial [Acidobacteriota bacterium]|nr:hypothetical protein [Acidobacteriota bacterium]